MAAHAASVAGQAKELKEIRERAEVADFKPRYVSDKQFQADYTQIRAALGQTACDFIDMKLRMPRTPLTEKWADATSSAKLRLVDPVHGTPLEEGRLAGISGLSTGAMGATGTGTLRASGGLAYAKVAGQAIIDDNGGDPDLTPDWVERRKSSKTGASQKKRKKRKARSDAGGGSFQCTGRGS